MRHQREVSMQWTPLYRLFLDLLKNSLQKYFSYYNLRTKDLDEFILCQCSHLFQYFLVICSHYSKILVIIEIKGNLADTYLFRVNNENIKTICEICSKLTIKTFVLVSLQLTLNRSHSFGVSIVDLPVGEYWQDFLISPNF